MPSHFSALAKAILADDRTRVKVLLSAHPGRAAEGRAEEDHLEAAIGHWIYKGDTALHVAAAGCRVEMAKLFLADAPELIAVRNRRGAQALHYAADGHPGSPTWDPARQVTMLKLLLKAGAEVDAEDKNGATPLHRAVRTRFAAAVSCLLEAGADPTRRNKSGSTSFHLAVQNTGRGGSGTEVARAAQREIIETFLKHGVSPSLRDAEDKSVREWASSGWVREMLAGSEG